jgi:hypothetical protein
MFALLLLLWLGPHAALAELIAELVISAAIVGGGGGGRLVRTLSSMLGRQPRRAPAPA